MKRITPVPVIAAIPSTPSLPAVVAQCKADLQGETIDPGTLSRKIALYPLSCASWQRLRLTEEDTCAVFTPVDEALTLVESAISDAMP